MSDHHDLADSYPEGYDMVLGIAKTPRFVVWFSRLKDEQGRRAIRSRLRKIELYQRMIGDTKNLGGGVIEMRFFTGPGYRIYATRSKGRLLILMAGGTKGSQIRDIAEAKRLAKEINNGEAHFE
jgi:putative addiction module killer protein